MTKPTRAPVGQTVVDAISGELLRSCGNQNEVTLQTSVDDLADDLLVGEPDDETVFRRVAFQEIRTGKEKILSTQTHYLFFAWVTSLLRA